jgi:hypothetical protein|tara:strand:- start:139 stop:417 length:279 start_codon:yes stop_codon:yes gene_type:complete
MAFLRSGLSRIGGSGDSGAAWKYASTDSIATALGDDYFLPAISEISVNDLILVSDSNGSPAVTISFCLTNDSTEDMAGTTITFASGTAIGNV